MLDLSMSVANPNPSISKPIKLSTLLNYAHDPSYPFHQRALEILNSLRDEGVVSDADVESAKKTQKDTKTKVGSKGVQQDDVIMDLADGTQLTKDILNTEEKLSIVEENKDNLAFAELIPFVDEKHLGRFADSKAPQIRNAVAQRIPLNQLNKFYNETDESVLETVTNRITAIDSEHLLQNKNLTKEQRQKIGSKIDSFNKFKYQLQNEPYDEKMLKKVNELSYNDFNYAMDVLKPKLAEDKEFNFTKHLDSKKLKEYFIGQYNNDDTLNPVNELEKELETNKLKVYRGGKFNEKQGYVSTEADYAEGFGDVEPYEIDRDSVLDLTNPEHREMVSDAFGEDTLFKLSPQGDLPIAGDDFVVDTMQKISKKLGFKASAQSEGETLPFSLDVYDTSALATPEDAPEYEKSIFGNTPDEIEHSLDAMAKNNYEGLLEIATDFSDERNKDLYKNDMMKEKLVQNLKPEDVSLFAEDKSEKVRMEVAKRADEKQVPDLMVNENAPAVKAEYIKKVKNEKDLLNEKLLFHESPLVRREVAKKVTDAESVEKMLQNEMKEENQDIQTIRSLVENTQHENANSLLVAGDNPVLVDAISKKIETISNDEEFANYKGFVNEKSNMSILKGLSKVATEATANEFMTPDKINTLDASNEDVNELFNELLPKYSVDNVSRVMENRFDELKPEVVNNLFTNPQFYNKFESDDELVGFVNGVINNKELIEPLEKPDISKLKQETDLLRANAEEVENYNFLGWKKPVSNDLAQKLVEFMDNEEGFNDDESVNQLYDKLKSKTDENYVPIAFTTEDTPFTFSDGEYYKGDEKISYGEYKDAYHKYINKDADVTGQEVFDKLAQTMSGGKESLIKQLGDFGVSGIEYNGKNGNNDYDFFNADNEESVKKQKFQTVTDDLGKTISFNEAENIVKQYFSEGEIDVHKATELFTKHNAFGSYLDGLIKFVENPDESTPYHETVHAYLDMFYTPNQKKELFNSLRGLVGISKKYSKPFNLLTDAEAEEEIAELFFPYVQKKKEALSTVKGKVKYYFDKAIDFIKSFIGKEDKIKKLFENIENKKRSSSIKTVEKNGEVHQEFAPAFYSRLVDEVEKRIQGKTVKVQSIPNLLKNASKEEIKWSGLDDFIRENAKNGVIDKQAILDYLAENNVKVDMKFGKADGSPYSERYIRSSYIQKFEGTYVEATITSNKAKELPAYSSDKTHFGEQGDYVSWFRGQVIDRDGKKIFHLDEVQSKRHDNEKSKPDLESSAPFQDYTEITLKNLLRYCAERGIDGITLSTPKQIKNLYSLSKAYSNVLAMKNSDGTYNLRLIAKPASDGVQENPNKELSHLSEKDLRAYVGDGIAEKIMTSEPNMKTDAIEEGDKIADGIYLDKFGDDSYFIVNKNDVTYPNVEHINQVLADNFDEMIELNVSPYNFKSAMFHLVYTLGTNFSRNFKDIKEKLQNATKYNMGGNAELIEKLYPLIADDLEKINAEKFSQFGYMDFQDIYYYRNGISVPEQDLELGGEWADELYGKKIPNTMSKLLKKLGMNYGIGSYDLTDMTGQNSSQPFIPITQDLKNTVLMKGQPLFQNNPYQESINHLISKTPKEDLINFVNHDNQYLRTAIAENIDGKFIHLMADDKSSFVRDVLYKRLPMKYLLLPFGKDKMVDNLPALRERLADELLKENINPEMFAYFVDTKDEILKDALTGIEDWTNKEQLIEASKKLRAMDSIYGNERGEDKATIDETEQLIKNNLNDFRMIFKSQIQEAYKLSDDQSNESMKIMDARANRWASETGKTPEEWYRERFLGAVNVSKPKEVGSGNNTLYDYDWDELHRKLYAYEPMTKDEVDYMIHYYDGRFDRFKDQFANGSKLDDEAVDYIMSDEFKNYVKSQQPEVEWETPDVATEIDMFLSGKFENMTIKSQAKFVENRYKDMDIKEKASQMLSFLRYTSAELQDAVVTDEILDNASIDDIENYADETYPDMHVSANVISRISDRLPRYFKESPFKAIALSELLWQKGKLSADAIKAIEDYDLYRIESGDLKTMAMGAYVAPFLFDITKNQLSKEFVDAVGKLFLENKEIYDDFNSNGGLLENLYALVYHSNMDDELKAKILDKFQRDELSGVFYAGSLMTDPSKFPAYFDNAIVSPAVVDYINKIFPTTEDLKEFITDIYTHDKDAKLSNWMVGGLKDRIMDVIETSKNEKEGKFLLGKLRLENYDTLSREEQLSLADDIVENFDVYSDKEFDLMSSITPEIATDVFDKICHTENFDNTDLLGYLLQRKLVSHEDVATKFNWVGFDGITGIINSKLRFDRENQLKLGTTLLKSLTRDKLKAINDQERNVTERTNILGLIMFHNTDADAVINILDNLPVLANEMGNVGAFLKEKQNYTDEAKKKILRHQIENIPWHRIETNRIYNFLALLKDFADHATNSEDMKLFDKVFNSNADNLINFRIKSFELYHMSEKTQRDLFESKMKAYKTAFDFNTFSSEAQIELVKTAYRADVEYGVQRGLLTYQSIKNLPFSSDEDKQLMINDNINNLVEYSSKDDVIEILNMLNDDGVKKIDIGRLHNNKNLTINDKYDIGKILLPAFTQNGDGNVQQINALLNNGFLRVDTLKDANFKAVLSYRSDAKKIFDVMTELQKPVLNYGELKKGLKDNQLVQKMDSILKKIYGKDFDAVKSGKIKIEEDKLRDILNNQTEGLFALAPVHRNGMQTIGGNDEAISIFADMELTDAEAKIMEKLNKLQVASGHPSGIGFSLFTRFDGGKSAVITEVQSDYFQKKKDAQFMNMMQSAGVSFDTMESISSKMKNIEKIWKDVLVKQTIRQLSEQGVENFYFNTPEGIEDLGASPAEGTIKSTYTELPKKLGFGEATTINVNGKEWSAYDKLSPESLSNILWKANGLDKHAAVKFLEEDKAILFAFKNFGNVTSMFHELGHVLRRDLKSSTEGQTDLMNLEDAFGVTDGNWTVEAEEKFAKAFEKYLFDGADVEGLDEAFENVKDWFRDVYENLENSPADEALSDDLKDIFNRMFLSPTELMEKPLSNAEKIRIGITPYTDKIGKFRKLRAQYDNLVNEGDTEGAKKVFDAILDEGKKYFDEKFAGMKDVKVTYNGGLGYFFGGKEPTLNMELEISNPEAKRQIMKNLLDFAVDFKQENVHLLKQIYDDEAVYGQVQEDGSMVQPCVDIKFNESLSEEQLEQVYKKFEELGLAGFTINGDYTGITFYNITEGDDYEQFDNQAKQAIDWLKSEGLAQEVSTKDVQLWNYGNKEYGATRSYGEVAGEYTLFGEEGQGRTLDNGFSQRERYSIADEKQRSFEGRSGRDSEPISVGGKQVQAKTVFEPKDDRKRQFTVHNIATTPVYEIDDADAYYEAIKASKQDNKFGSSVYLYSKEELADMKLFVSGDGMSGVAVKKNGDIVSAFNNPKNPVKNFTQLFLLAIENGGSKLDCFNTVLPDIYSRFGFKVVARTKWNDEFAPEDWDKSVYKKFNNGEPDVVFMAYDGGLREQLIDNIDRYPSYYYKNDVPYVDYDTAVMIQNKKLADLYATGKEREFIRTREDAENSPAFKKFFGDWTTDKENSSKVVDEDGRPRVVFHGSTHDIDEFDPNKSDKDNWWGSMLYFTSSATDVNKNYAGIGPDLANRIERDADRMYSAYQDGMYEFEDGEDDGEEKNYEYFKEKAKANLVGNEGGSVYPVYLDIKKPAVIKKNGGTYIDATQQPNSEFYMADADEAIREEMGEDVDTDSEEFKEAVRDRATELAYDYGDIEQSEEFLDFQSALELAGQFYDVDTDAILGTLLSDYPEGFNLYDLEQIIRQMDVSDDMGDYATGSFLQRLYQNMGYDGIIFHNAEKQFSQMGMDYDTTHYMVFEPTQVKSATGNVGDFSKESRKIIESNATVNKEPKYRKGSEQSFVQEMSYEDIDKFIRDFYDDEYLKSFEVANQDSINYLIQDVKNDANFRMPYFFIIDGKINSTFMGDMLRSYFALRQMGIDKFPVEFKARTINKDTNQFENVTNVDAIKQIMRDNGLNIPDKDSKDNEPTVKVDNEGVDEELLKERLPINMDIKDIEELLTLNGGDWYQYENDDEMKERVQMTSELLKTAIAKSKTIKPITITMGKKGILGTTGFSTLVALKELGEKNVPINLVVKDGDNYVKFSELSTVEKASYVAQLKNHHKFLKNGKKEIAVAKQRLGEKVSRIAEVHSELNKYKKVFQNFDKEYAEFERMLNRVPDDVLEAKIIDYEKRRDEALKSQNAVYKEMRKLSRDLKDVLFGETAEKNDKKHYSADTDDLDDISTVRMVKDTIWALHDIVDLSNVPVVNFKPIREEGKRAYYDNGQIYLNADSNDSTVAHEFGHHLENSDAGIKKACFEFLDKRTEGELAQPLNKILPFSGYRDGEIARKDNFKDAYSGKVYDSDTEILSMGLQYMYDDPAQFLKDDPEYFNFVTDVLNGKYTTGKKVEKYGRGYSDTKLESSAPVDVHAEAKAKINKFEEHARNVSPIDVGNDVSIIPAKFSRNGDDMISVTFEIDGYDEGNALLHNQNQVRLFKKAVTNLLDKQDRIQEIIDTNKGDEADFPFFEDVDDNGKFIVKGDFLYYVLGTDGNDVLIGHVNTDKKFFDDVKDFSKDKYTSKFSGLKANDKQPLTDFALPNPYALKKGMEINNPLLSKNGIIIDEDFDDTINEIFYRYKAHGTQTANSRVVSMSVDYYMKLMKRSKFATEQGRKVGMVHQDDVDFNVVELSKQTPKRLIETTGSGAGNISYFVKDEEGKNLALFKPSITETLQEIIGGIPTGTGCSREVYAYYVDKLMGFGVTPPTIYRNINGMFGSYQKFAENAEPLGARVEGHGGWNKLMEEVEKMGDETIEKMYLFDYITANADRHANNLLVGKTDNKANAIDNGFSMPDSDLTWIRNDLYTHVDDALDLNKKPYLKEIFNNMIKPEVLDELKERFVDTGFISEDAYKGMLARIDNIIDGGGVLYSYLDENYPKPDVINQISDQFSHLTVEEALEKVKSKVDFV